MKSDSLEAEVEGGNLTAPLFTHVFSIGLWFSSVFIITISGSIPPLRDGYPICGLPISCAFPSSSPPLGHISITACQKRYHRWPEQVWKKKGNGKLSSLLCIKLKHLVRRGPNSLSARVRCLKKHRHFGNLYYFFHDHLC